MSSNIVYMIGDKGNGRIFDASRECFDNNIGFNSFYPSRHIAEDILDRNLCDSGEEYYKIIEAEVIGFDGRELTVGYEPFIDDPFL